MSIVKMKLATVHAGKDQFEDVLQRCRTCTDFHPEPADRMVTEDNGGKLLQQDNVYA